LSEFINRLRLNFGDLISSFTDKEFTTIFNKGKEFLDTNIADPFFSKMKSELLGQEHTDLQRIEKFTS